MPYGIYELKLTVTMENFPTLISTASAFVNIISSAIIPNLVPLGTTVITHGYQQDLILNPGKYSVDPDQNEFNASVSENFGFCIVESVQSLK